MLNKFATVIIGLTCLGLVSAHGAAIQYGWLAPGNTLIDKDSGNIAAGNATVLTYLSQDQIIEFDTGSPLSLTYDDDIFHSAMANTFDGQYWTASYYEADSAYVGYYLYAVTLNLPFASFTDIASVPVGTFYGISALGQDSTAPGSPGALSAIPPAAAQNFIGGAIQTTFQVIVPEPAQFILTFLAATGIFYRRRLQAR